MKGESIENLEELKLSATAWTTIEVVSTESTTNSFNPTIAVDGARNVHIAWDDFTNYDGSGSDQDIFYKRWNSTSSTWTTTEVVSTESMDHSSSPTIAVDKIGNVHVAWQDQSNYSGVAPGWSIFYKRWNVTSSTWTTTEVVSTESTDNSRSPTIAVDNVRNLHVAWHDNSNYGGSEIDHDIFYKLWNATSSTWTTTEVVSTESTDNSRHPTIAVDNVRNLHVAWDDSTNYGSSGLDKDIFYKLWNTTSNTWTTVEVLSIESTLDSHSPTIAVNSTGNAHVAWFDWTDYRGSGPDLDIFYTRWNSTISTWTTTEVVSNTSTWPSYFPTIAVDGAGNAHVAWYDLKNYGYTGPNYDIIYKLWNATSNTWTTADMVSIESALASWYPTIAVEGAGNVHVAWQDYTNYGGAGPDTDIFYKQLKPLLSGPDAPGIPGYNIFLLIGIICVVSVILFKKRIKKIF